MVACLALSACGLSNSSMTKKGEATPSGGEETKHIPTGAQADAELPKEDSWGTRRFGISGWVALEPMRDVYFQARLGFHKGQLHLFELADDKALQFASRELVHESGTLVAKKSVLGEVLLDDRFFMRWDGLVTPVGTEAARLLVSTTMNNDTDPWNESQTDWREWSPGEAALRELPAAFTNPVPQLAYPLGPGDNLQYLTIVGKGAWGFFRSDSYKGKAPYYRVHSKGVEPIRSSSRNMINASWMVDTVQQKRWHVDGSSLVLPTTIDPTLNPRYRSFGLALRPDGQIVDGNILMGPGPKSPRILFEAEDEDSHRYRWFTCANHLWLVHHETIEEPEGQYRTRFEVTDFSSDVPRVVSSYESKVGITLTYAYGRFACGGAQAAVLLSGLAEGKLKPHSKDLALWWAAND